MARDVKEMTDAEIVARIVRLAFDGNCQKFEAFKETLRAGLPEGTEVLLRGSVVTNERWEDGEPFDADGPGTSDLDVTLVGDAVMDCWDEDAFYIPRLHTKPLGDKDPDIAPALNPLRLALQRMVQRPVNFQATNNLVVYARDVLLKQPCFKIVESEAEEETEDADAEKGDGA